MFATNVGDAVRVPVSYRRSEFPQSRLTGKLAAHFAEHSYDDPTVVIDLDIVEAQYRALAQGLAPAHIHYAVKANPEPAILRTLVREGSRFDAASRAELEMCLAEGAQPEDLSFGNTVKRVRDIEWAYAQGIDLFAADAVEELEKIAMHAPGARVYIRFLVEESQADWPLSRKFGAPAEEIIPLMDRAAALGLRPVGISFHVGSQTRQPMMWCGVLDEVSAVWHKAIAHGHSLDLLNIGGGFPAFYGDPIEAPLAYGQTVMRLVRDRFGDVPYVMAEPGRGLVAEAGVIEAEVLLVARKRPDDIARWVYLSIGKFSGLAETIDEAIRYQIDTTADDGTAGPCILAGPSCDSADVLYEQRPMMMPLGLRAGDKIHILCTGAYTTTYASVGFNGFPPLASVCI